MADYTSFKVLATHPVPNSLWDWSVEPRIVEVAFEDGYPNATGFVCKADHLGMSSIIDTGDEPAAIKSWLRQHGMTMVEATPA